MKQPKNKHKHCSWIHCVHAKYCQAKARNHHCKGVVSIVQPTIDLMVTENEAS